MNHDKNGGNIDPTGVALANQKGMQQFGNLQIYEVLREEEFKPDPKAINIGIKSVDMNKGTRSVPMIKARFLGREFEDDTKKRELFAGKPRICFCGQPPIIIDVPTEDARRQPEGVILEIGRYLYGTRDAPVIWQ